MNLALVLVAFVAACLGAALAFVAPGAVGRPSAMWRWWRHRRGERPLVKITGAEGGTVTIEGVLRTGGDGARVLLATAVPPEDSAGVPGAKAVSAAAPEVWIDLPDGAALVDGDAVVVSGSVEIAPGQSAGAVARDLGELAAELCSVVKWQVRCLRAGDRIRAVGRLERAPDLEGPGGYRTREARHRLLPAEGRRNVEIAGVRSPRPFVRRRSRVIAAAIGATSAVALALGSLSYLRPEVAKPEIAPEGPSAELTRLLAEHRHEEAADRAEGEQQYAVAARAYFMAGRLPSAARMFAAARNRAPRMAPSFAELDAYIADHRYDDAARIADALEARQGGGGFGCFARALRFKAQGTEPIPDPFVDKIDSSLAWLCTLANADVAGVKPRLAVLKRHVDVLDFDMPKQGSPRAPGAREMDARIAALLLRSEGEVRHWPFELPHGAHALRAEGLYFRIPVPALEAAARFPDRHEDEGHARSRSLEQSTHAAIWLSYLGDHLAAAEAYREALLAVRLDMIAPKPRSAPGRRFEVGVAGRIDRVLFDIVAKREKHATALTAIGAALSLRAREADHAAIYVGLLPEEEDTTGVRRYLYMIENAGTQPSFHLEGIETPARRDLLKAGLADDPAGLLSALQKTDGQGLWPIFGPKLRLATEPLREWSRGGGPAGCEDCGFYGLLAFWADRRAAAQAIDAFPVDRILGGRIGQLRAVLADRDVNVLLYVSGRLVSPYSD